MITPHPQYLTIARSRVRVGVRHGRGCSPPESPVMASTLRHRPERPGYLPGETVGSMGRAIRRDQQHGVDGAPPQGGRQGGGHGGLSPCLLNRNGTRRTSGVPSGPIAAKGVEHA